MLPPIKDTASGSVVGGGAASGASGGASGGLVMALVALLVMAAACLGGIVPIGGPPAVGTKLILKTERPG
jgi:hypothetical protein